MGKIFRSRWSALIWAGGILWTAYDVAEATAPPAHPAGADTRPKRMQPTDATGATVSDDDLTVLAAFANAE